MELKFYLSVYVCMCDYSSQVSCSIGLKVSGDLSWKMRHVINYIRARSMKKKISTLLPTWKWEIEGSLNPKLKKKLLCWKWSGRARKVIESWFRVKKYFLPLSGEIFFSGLGMTKNEKKNFFAGNGLGGREKSSKVDFEKKKICLSLWSGWGLSKNEKKHFAGNGEKTHRKLILRTKILWVPEAEGRKGEAKGQKWEAKGRKGGRRPICEDEGLPPAFRRK